MRAVAEKIALAIHSTGPINVQGRNTSKGFYVFEINPRFSSTTIMRAIVGFNEVDMMIQLKMFGKKVQQHTFLCVPDHLCPGVGPLVW